eukprot:6035809-Pyramimonas_sp.AAC.1
MRALGLPCPEGKCLPRVGALCLQRPSMRARGEARPKSRDRAEEVSNACHRVSRLVGVLCDA